MSYIPEEILLIKNGELALKGLNRGTFEAVLLKNLRRRLKSVGHFQIRKSQSTIYVEPLDEWADMEEAARSVSQVFGIAAYSRAKVVAKDLAAIEAAAPVYLADTLRDAKTFKVESKRADKTFPHPSPVISREVGGAVLEAFPHLKVDVHHPDVVVNVEVRDFGAYIHTRQLPGAGGMPVGTAGKAAILISGGIDSPVAAYMMAKRGIALTAIHFASPPYTSERAEEKVCELLRQVSQYAGHIRMFTVPFTELQEAIRDHCPEELFTLVMRRMMMRIASMIAVREECGALITGESLGQVASQTIPALACTDAVATLPVFRPVIGMDKEEIIRIARKIDTFDISIQPYEDCCTVFTPRHPRTRPTLAMLDAAEAAFDFEPMLTRAADNARIVKL